MAITKITDPSALPTSTDDYVAQNNAIDIHTLNSTPPFPIIGGNVVKGSIFNIGGDLFYTDTDTAVSGTASDYVKLTVSGTTATASYETAANITANVSWNDTYNGYYDSSGNLYLFDETLAKLEGTITTLYSDYGKKWENSIGQDLRTSGSVEFSNILMSAGGHTEALSSPTQANLYTLISPVLVSDGDACILSGGVYSYSTFGSSNDRDFSNYVFSHAVRDSPTTIIVYGNIIGLRAQDLGTTFISASGQPFNITLTDGSSSLLISGSATSSLTVAVGHKI